MKRLITFLYNRYCRKSIEKAKKPIPLEKLSQPERENLCRRCKMYAEDDLLIWLSETLVAEKEYTALYDSSHFPIETTEARLHLERINGIGDFIDKIKDLASQAPYDDSEPFDKHAGI
jgi:hypothetical protein